MLPDRVLNPGPLTYESGALPIALHGPALNGSNTDGSFTTAVSNSFLGFLGANPIWHNLGWFSFLYWEMVCCVYSLESSRWGDSDENTQCTFMLKKIEKMSLLCLLTLLYNKPSMPRTTPVSNIFSWFQRCSSHWSSTVCRMWWQASAQIVRKIGNNVEKHAERELNYLRMNYRFEKIALFHCMNLR